jgi:hypothetical protein
MKLEQVRQKLLAAARANTPSDRVPYGFEKRITALLQSCPALDFWAQWSQALWRAALPCVAGMIMLAAVAFLASSSSATTTLAEEFPQDFQQTMLAAAYQGDQSGEVW